MSDRLEGIRRRLAASQSGDIHAYAREGAFATADIGALLSALDAANAEIARLHAELAAAREALGAAWLLNGTTLAEGIRRKTSALERLNEPQRRRAKATYGGEP